MICYERITCFDYTRNYEVATDALYGYIFGVYLVIWLAIRFY